MSRLSPSRDELVNAVAILAITLVAVFSFHSSYGGVAFLVNAAIAAALALLIVHVGRSLAWPAAVTTVFALVGYVLVASLLALRHYGYGRVVPSHTSIYESLTSTATAWKELITTAPPVGSTGDLMVLPVFIGFATAFAMAVLAATRWSPLAVLPPFVTLGLGIAVGTNEPVSIVLHGAVLAALVYAWLAYREHVRRPLLHVLGLDWRALLTGAIVLAGVGGAALWVGPRMPGADHTPRAIWRQTVTPPFDPRVYPSPLGSYRDYVKLDRDPTTGEPHPDEELFTIEGLPAGVPVRMATMDAYDGLVWQVSGGDPDEPSLRDSGSFERVGASIPADTEGETAEVAVTIAAYNDVWIPDVGEVISLRFAGSAGGPERDRELADSFRYNRETDTAATPLRLSEGDRYVMTVRLPNMVDELTGHHLDPSAARVGSVQSVDQLTAALGTPDVWAIGDTAQRLDRIAQLMVGSGAYSDGDRQLGQRGSRAGHSAYRLTEFAGDFPSTPLVGNAEQYAATYALLFRDLDSLPTRVVMGFRPTESSLQAPVTVFTTDVDAWVEVPVQGLGWVAVFPTPPRDQLAAAPAAPLEPEPEYRTQNPPPPPLVDPEFDRPATAAGAERALQEEENEEPTTDRSDAGDESISNRVGEFVRRPVVVATAIAASPFVLFGLALVGVAIAKLMRRRNRRTRGPGHARVANGWREMTDLALDLGRPVPEATTRREEAGFIDDGPGRARSAVALAERADRAVWSGEDITDADVDAYWTELNEELKGVRRSVGVRRRWWSRVSWQSLRRRRDADG